MRGCRPAGTRTRLLYVEALDEWAARAKTWAEGKVPADLERADPSTKTAVKPRDVFVYFISEGKVRAPHGAMALMERVG